MFYDASLLVSQDSTWCFSVQIPAHYAVKDDGSGWRIALEKEELPIRTCTTKKVPENFHFEDWADFNLYPENAFDGNLLVAKSKLPECELEGTMNLPWDGKTPTLEQASLSGSFTTSEFSSTNPSSFSQVFSSIREWFPATVPEQFSELARFGASLATNILWKLFDRYIGFSFCASDGACDVDDPYLSHSQAIFAGGLVTSTVLLILFYLVGSLGMTVGQHHMVDKADISQTLKIIYTSDFPDVLGSLSQFFRNPFNEGKRPGEYFWPPYPGVTYGHPLRSPQIFENYMDQTTIEEMSVLVEGTFIQAWHMNLTTIANPMLGVLAGQNVDLLLFVARETDQLPASLALGAIDPTKYEFAAKTIAESRELLAIIENFAQE